MSTRAPGPASAVAAYENFLYLLREIEVSIERGNIHWTEESAQSAQRRLADILAKVIVETIRLHDAQSDPSAPLH